MIIDIHTHLGDILNPHGGRLIYRKNVSKKIFFDIISQSERMLHRGICDRVDRWLYAKVSRLVTGASRARNATATLENMRSSMDAAGVVKSACMPIPPYLTFEDLKKAQRLDGGIIPFTGVDYTRPHEIASALCDDVSQGARGMKLHPVIQKVALTSNTTFQAVEAFAPFDLPVLIHCGISSYYLNGDGHRQNPAFGEIHYLRELAANFPQVTFIAGHAGLYEYRAVIDQLGGYKNVMVDTSFQPPGHVRELIAFFGGERVLFGSDWPYGNRKPAIAIVKKACGGDKPLARRIFYDNAAALVES